MRINYSSIDLSKNGRPTCGMRQIPLALCGTLFMLSAVAAQPIVDNEPDLIGNTAMVAVVGGVLPSTSELSGQTVNSFHIGKYEVTWGEWKQVRDWAVANGYADLERIGTGGSDNHPVRLVNWYDAVKWCNAKSEKEGLNPVYLRSGQVYRQGEGPSDSRYDPNSQVLYVIDRDYLANGYRLPTDAEWEWAARGGVSSRGFIFSGSDDLNAVGWYKDNSSGAPAAFLNGRGTYPVGLKQPNELGIYDMSGNASEWVWDSLGDWRRVRGGAFHLLQELCEVGKRSADAAGYRDSDTYVKGGFRVARASTHAVLTLQKTGNLTNSFVDVPVTADMIGPDGKIDVGAMTNGNGFFRMIIEAVVK